MYSSLAGRAGVSGAGSGAGVEGSWWVVGEERSGRERERGREGLRPGVPRARACAVDHVARGPEVGKHRAGAVTGMMAEKINVCSSWRGAAG